MSMAEELERLEGLRQAGTLSDEEFETAKANLLNEKPAAGDGLGLGETIDKFASDEKQWAMMIHLSQLLGFVVPVAGMAVPIVLWQIKKDTSRSIDQHGRVVANWVITELILGVICFIAVFFFVGILMVIALAAVGVAFPVIGGIKANNGELWPYPMSFPFFPVEADELSTPEEVASHDSDGPADQDWTSDGHGAE